MARRLAVAESDPLTFWTKLSERSQSNLYFALVFLDRDRRNAFRDVYRFVRAADDVADTPGDPELNLSRLGAWRDQLDAIYAGGATHPYAHRLQRVVQRYGLERRHFDTLLDGLERDVRTPIIADQAELETYCETVASPVAYLCLQILGVSGRAEELYARDVGIALQLANILRDIEEDAARGYIYIPQDDLRRVGISNADLIAGHIEGIAPVCRDLADRARALIASARARLSRRARQNLLVPEIWADVYLLLLDELQRFDFDVFRNQPYLRRRRKLALALRRWAAEAPPSWASRIFPGRPGMW